MKILLIKLALFILALTLLQLGVGLKYRDGQVPQKAIDLGKEAFYFMASGLLLLLVSYLSIFHPGPVSILNFVLDVFGAVGLGAVFLSMGCSAELFWLLIKRSRRFPDFIQLPSLVCRLL